MSKAPIFSEIVLGKTSLSVFVPSVSEKILENFAFDEESSDFDKRFLEELKLDAELFNCDPFSFIKT